VAQRILIAGGGTGGHLMPTLNLAAALSRAEPEVHLVLVGAERGIEARIFPDCGYEYRLLPTQPLYRSKPWRNWRVVAGAPAVLSGVRSVFRDLDPSLVVGTGGYASAPAVAWAIATGRRLALQEQNAMPGVVTRLFARYASQVHLGNPEARRHLRFGRRTTVIDSGNPVATELTRQEYDWPSGRIVLVMGGSQGARGLNDRLLAGLGSGALPDDVTVVWISGPANEEAVAARLHGTAWADRVRLVPYIPDLGSQLRHAKLAICRAGAMTCAELAVAGLPAILVPLPSAAGDHQTFNARALEEAGAAVLRKESEVGGGGVWNLARELLKDEARRKRMAASMAARGRPDAADTIATELLRLAASGRTVADD
jgi:UDP-N-acetylglucosamine--N-acetylmuramyl-(pentapeptide) pyrophosphoryl-undecaprenol N-acetylglucosamine transferase